MARVVVAKTFNAKLLGQVQSVFTYLPIYLHTYLPMYLFIYLPIYLFTYLPIYLFTSIFIGWCVVYYDVLSDGK
jgi:dolichyl-phosphate-mannose--protein O-mannosyl transferase